jgi:hypothetical protein
MRRSEWNASRRTILIAPTGEQREAVADDIDAVLKGSAALARVRGDVRSYASIAASGMKAVTTPLSTLPMQVPR